MMERIHWDKQSWFVGEERRFLISGEFHYFRVPQQDWRTRLRLWKEAGGNAIATYIPWLIHEPQEGQFVFAGQPWLEIEEFLQVCAEEKMHVLARPGPYQYSELRGEGVPMWVFEKNPQVLATDVAGKARRQSSASYMHPVFLEKVGRWFDQICPILARHTLDKGGPVALVQFDNELMGIHEWFGGWDYNAETMGFGKPDGRYARFLQAKYGDVAAVNAAYGTTFPTLADARPIEGKDHARIEDRRRVRDYMLCYFQTVGEYAATLMDMLKNRGLNMPFVHNAANQNMNAYFREMMARTRGEVMLATDHYYALDMDWPQNNPTPLYASKCFHSLEMLRMMGCPPTVFEMPAGSCSDFPPITATDLKACYMMHAAMGLKGLNYYIFTGGPNPPDAGITTDMYDYAAAIGPAGEIRPHYYTEKEYGEFLHANTWLTTATATVDFNIGLDWEHSRSANFFANRGDLEMSSADAWLVWRKGMFFSARAGSWSPGMVDLESDEVMQAIDKPLWVATSVCMSRAIQERLVKFVEAGGRLLIAPVVPYLDEDFRPCTVLRDYLDGAAAEPFDAFIKRVAVGPVKNIWVSGRLFTAGKMPADAREIGRDEVSGKTVAWSLDKGGKGGRVVWLGLQWTHKKSEHTQMASFLMEACGANRPAIACSNPNLWTILRSDGQRQMLFILNLFSSPMEADIALPHAQPQHYRLDPMEVRAVEL